MLKRIIVLPLIAVLTACTPSSPASPAAPVSGTPAPAIQTEKLTVIQTVTVDTLDAHTAQRPEAFMIVARINEALIDRNPQTLEFIPGLALSWRSIDDKTWEFKLRPGVTFTNGEQFTSATVKYNVDRIIDPDLKAAKGGSMRPLIDRVETPDPTTARIVTKAPYAMLLERLTSFWIVPEQFAKDKGPDYVGLNPIGTGPYKFVEWQQGTKVTITRNDAYWGDKPAFRDVIFRPIAESSTALAELLNGSADLVVNLAPDQVDTVKKSGKLDVYNQPSVNVLELRMDALGRGGPNPFTDKRVRQAANYAINKEAIAATLMGGYSKVIATNIVPQMFGYDDSVKPYPFDTSKARQLLAEAGYPNGIDVDFLWHDVTGFREQKSIGEAVASDLGKAGIRVKLRNVGPTEYTPLTQAGKAGPIFMGNNVNGSFFDGGFGFFYLRKQYTSSYYYSDELEAMILKVETTLDPNVRKQTLSQIQKLLHEEAPYVWGWTGFSLVGLNSNLTFVASPDGDPRVHLIKPKR